MDFSRIDSFMKETGLASEPAFDYLHFLNEPIPATMTNRRLLGLYYPEGGHDQYGYLPPSTIHLPPDASYSTLLHELGHRYGHYYYNNLSEEFAENYRRAQESKLAPVYRSSYSYAKEVPMEKIMSQSRICEDCPERIQGAGRLCAWCDYGGWTRTSWERLSKLTIPHLLGLPAVGLVSDWDTYGGMVITDFPDNPLPGDNLWVKVTGTVRDIKAGLVSAWQLAVAAAVVDSNGRPSDTSRRMRKMIYSSQYLYSTILQIRDPLDNEMVLTLGKMPSTPVSIQIELFANHSDTPLWDWSMW